jgi:hypothetical protein
LDNNRAGFPGLLIRTVAPKGRFAASLGRETCPVIRRYLTAAPALRADAGGSVQDGFELPRPAA